MRKLSGQFINRIPLSFGWDLSYFRYLKQGNFLHPCMAYSLSHGLKEEDHEHMDVCLQVMLSTSMFVLEMVYDMVEVYPH